MFKIKNRTPYWNMNPLEIVIWQSWRQAKRSNIKKDQKKHPKSNLSILERTWASLKWNDVQSCSTPLKMHHCAVRWTILKKKGEKREKRIHLWVKKKSILLLSIFFEKRSLPSFPHCHASKSRARACHAILP